MRDGLEGIRRLDGVRREELVGRPTDGAGDLDEVKTPTSDEQGLVPPAPEVDPRPPAGWSGPGARGPIEAKRRLTLNAEVSIPVVSPLKQLCSSEALKLQTTGRSLPLTPYNLPDRLNRPDSPDSERRSGTEQGG